MNEQQETSNKRISGLLTAAFLGASLVILLERILSRNHTLPPSPASSPPPIQIELKQPPSPPPAPTPIFDLSKLANSLLSALGAAIITAIFYISGWVYETHWHTYYGINISQIELSTSRVIIQGIPGILFFTAWIFAAFIIFTIGKSLFQEGSIQPRDAIYIIILAYVIATGALVTVLVNFADFTPGYSLLEVQIALLPSLLLLILAAQLLIPITLSTVFALLTALLTWVRDIGQKARQLSDELIQELLSSNRDSDVEPSAATRRTDRLLSWTVRILDSYVTLRNSLFKLFIDAFHKSFLVQVGDVISEFRLLGWSAPLLLLFLLSIAVSAWLGEFDARRGVRVLDGNWQLSPVFLFSDEIIQPLHTPLPTPPAGSTGTPTPNSYEYGPLGLVASNDSTYFLIDWQDWSDEQRFLRRPNVYQIPRSGDTNIQLFLPAPTFTPTPTLTTTPSPTAVTTLTPTPTP